MDGCVFFVNPSVKSVAQPIHSGTAVQISRGVVLSPIDRRSFVSAAGRGEGKEKPADRILLRSFTPKRLEVGAIEWPLAMNQSSRLPSVLPGSAAMIQYAGRD